MAPRTFRWSGALAVSLTAVWLAQARDSGVFADRLNPAGLFYGLNIGALQPWQFMTYDLVHTHGLHILGNLLTLALSCRAVEASTPRGTLPFIFFVGALAGAFFQVLLGPLFYDVTASVGASGGIAGTVCLATVMALSPSHRLRVRHRVLALVALGLAAREDVAGFMGHGFLAQIHAGGWFAGSALSLFYLRRPELTIRWASLGNELGYFMLTLAGVITISLLLRWV